MTVRCADGTIMGDQTRNLNPTPEARVAMIIWGHEYSQQAGGSMDFWDKLGHTQKRKCKIIVEELRKHDKQRPAVTGDENAD